MEKRGKASIIFNSTILAYTPNCGVYAVQKNIFRISSLNCLPLRIVQVDFMGAYALSKTTLLGLTKLMALELGPRGVRVNCICPGLIETRFGAAVS